MITDMQPKTGSVDRSHQSPYALWKALALSNVRLNDGFWATRQAVNRKVSLYYGFEMLEKAGNFHNLRLAAGTTTGSYRGRNFLDSDVYKWLEAVAWELGNRPDAALRDMADQAIALIVAAQRPDGYINSYYQVAEPESRWANLDQGHELYCAGHLFQAAVAFHNAVGDARLMIIARRFADHIDSIFGPDKRHATCGHPEIEMALVEMFRVTGERNYLDLAKFFIDQRGQRTMSGMGSYGPEYHQDHLPVRQATEAVGHAVRQLYLASGVTDLYLETGENALFDAMLHLSDDICSTKLYITGGVGSRFDGESFGDPYELPTDQCYCEGCASIASLMWNWRMLLATGESRFADQMEQALYNNVLSISAMDGQHFFYINPLMVRDAKYLRASTNPPADEFDMDPTPQRSAWHEVACCPPNVMRLLASMGHYLATSDKNGVQIHHFAASDIVSELFAEHQIGLHITTDYPWQGTVNLEITSTSDLPWVLSLRIPGWCPNYSVKINGQVVDNPEVEKGYLVLKRVWQLGDQVELDLVMKPVLVVSNPRVDATRGSLAIQRGPLIYCLEDCDQQVQGKLLDTQIVAQQELQPRWQADLLGGVMTIEAEGRILDTSGWQGKLYQPINSLPLLSADPVRLVAVPYFAWGNRGLGSMRVWIPAA